MDGVEYRPWWHDDPWLSAKSCMVDYGFHLVLLFVAVAVAAVAVAVVAVAAAVVVAVVVVAVVAAAPG